MSASNFPDSFPVTDESRKVTGPWAAWLSIVQSTVSAARQSGTSAQRPTTGLWVGRRYWDTTLTKPIFVASVRPAVWVDSAAIVV